MHCVSMCGIAFLVFSTCVLHACHVELVADLYYSMDSNFVTYSILYSSDNKDSLTITSTAYTHHIPDPMLLLLLILPTQSNKSVKALFTHDVQKIQY